MPLDAFTKKRIEKIMNAYTEAKIPKHLRTQMRLTYKIRGTNVSLIEERLAYRGEGWVQHDIAQFRFDGSMWKVYWRDSKDKWHHVEEILPSSNFEGQLEIVENDNTGIFWG
jgi:hypothetical protein